MPGRTEYLVHPDADAVAEAIAEQLSIRIAQLQAEQPDRLVQIALTGGRIATKAYQRLAADGPSSPVDWTKVALWWGDERFVAADSDDRNDQAALAALVPALPLTDTNLNPMPADDGQISLDEAALAYGAELGNTAFDICLLGVGPDGHVASVFPDHPSFEVSLQAEADTPVIPVRDAPKPPPLRISITHRVINRSAEVWFTVSGSDKADAVGWAVTGNKQVPAGAAHGTERTLWLLDEAAAARIPVDLLN
ncbi:6-phosphogluconolactonase [Microlunatus endophyticus]|uniref:6-phosphogluconolactonase n=1 Tax=Microlunatus endophyticus TaxID=1716077 RepID=A0A917SB86_9ACTN|nr:6-phosphogluconolactonase [Microlunatus endophyticus]GGL68290.1 6-phosphogluconolactonase [Microlunatus endophyticus]